MGAERRIFGRCGGGGSGECVLGQAKTVAWEACYSRGMRTPCNCWLTGAQETFVEVMSAGNGLEYGDVRAGAVP